MSLLRKIIVISLCIVGLFVIVLGYFPLSSVMKVDPKFSTAFSLTGFFITLALMCFGLSKDNSILKKVWITFTYMFTVLCIASVSEFFDQYWFQRTIFRDITPDDMGLATSFFSFGFSLLLIAREVEGTPDKHTDHDKIPSFIRRLFRLRIIGVVTLVLLFAYVVEVFMQYSKARTVIVLLSGGLFHTQLTGSDYSGLINTIWAVEATITTIAATILTLLVGFSKDKVLGVSVFDYIAGKSVFIATRFWEGLLLCFAISILQVMFVSHAMLAGVVTLFAINMLVLLIVGIRVFVVFAFASKVENDINGIVKEKLIRLSNNENRNVEIDTRVLKELCIHTTELLETGDKHRYQANINFIREMFGEILSNCKHPNKSQMLDEITSYCNKFMEILIRQGNELTAAQYMVDYLKVCRKLNENKKAEQRQPFVFDLEDAIHALFQKMRTVGHLDDQLHEKALYIFELLMTNGQRESTRYFSWYYTLLIGELRIPTSNRERVIQRFLRYIVDHLYWSMKSYANQHQNLHKETLLALVTSAIVNNRGNDFEMFIKHIHEGTDDGYNSVIVAVVVYLYYISFREEYIPVGTRQRYKRFLELETIGSSCSKLISSMMYRLWSYYQDVHDYLKSGYEIFKEYEGKTLILQDAIDEFFVFSSCANQGVTHSLSEELKASILTFEHITKYLKFFNMDTLARDNQKIFSEFTYWLFGHCCSFDSSFVMLISESYRDFVFNKLFDFWHGTRAEENKDILNSAVTDLKGIIDSSPFIQCANRTETTDRLKILSSIVPVEAVSGIDQMFETHILRLLSSYAEDGLTKAGLPKIELAYGDENNLRVVLEKVNSLQTENSLRFERLIASSRHKSRRFYSGNQGLYGELDALEDNLEHIDNNSGSCTIFFNKKSVEFKYGGSTVVLRHMNQHEILLSLKEMESKTSKYHYDVPINQYVLRMSLGEAIYYQYFHALVLEIYVNFGLSVHDMNGGLLIV